jgi:hypothetical protein
VALEFAQYVFVDRLEGDPRSLKPISEMAGGLDVPERSGTDVLLANKEVVEAVEILTRGTLSVALESGWRREMTSQHGPSLGVRHIGRPDRRRHS